MKHLLTAIACCLAVAGSAQTWNPDADFDNVIGVNDLMALLSVFGSEWTAEYPQDPEFELAAYYEGQINYFECIRSCTNNHAKVIGMHEYAMFQDSIEAITSSSDDFHLDDWRGFWGGGYNYDGTRITLFGGTSSAYLYGTYNSHCFCTGLVPSVE